MDPATGTFLSVDPVVPKYDDPQSLNAYAYARNNPASSNDPTGMCPGGLFGGWCSQMIDGYVATWFEGEFTAVTETGASNGPSGGFGDTSFLGVDVGLANSLVGLGAIGARGEAGASPASGAPGNAPSPTNVCPSCHLGNPLPNPNAPTDPGIQAIAEAVGPILPALVTGGALGPAALPEIAANFPGLAAVLGVGGATSPLVFRSGELFQRTLQTSRGPVDVLAEVLIRGRTLTLQNIAIFGRGSEPLTGLTRELLAARTQLAALARGQGFHTLRITGQRIQSSTSANPGKIVDLTIDLTR